LIDDRFLWCCIMLSYLLNLRWHSGTYSNSYHCLLLCHLTIYYSFSFSICSLVLIIVKKHLIIVAIKLLIQSRNIVILLLVRPTHASIVLSTLIAGNKSEVVDMMTTSEHWYFTCHRRGLVHQTHTTKGSTKPLIMFPGFFLFYCTYIVHWWQ
jgi:hypothetical protein